MPLIVARPIKLYQPLTWLSHLRSIQAEQRAQWAERKEAARKRSQKAPAKCWNFRRSPKNTPILTIRGRKPKYLTKSELKEILDTHPADADDIKELLAKKSIDIKGD